MNFDSLVASPHMQLHKLTEPNKANIQLTQHEDGYVTGLFCYKKKS